MAMRKTILPRGGNRETLTSLQQWLLLSIWTGEQFDFLDFMLCEIEDVIADAINVGRQQMYPHIIWYLLNETYPDWCRKEYQVTENVLQTYHPALSGDRRHGQRALRAAQEQFSAEEIERHEEEDAALEQAEHEARLGGLMNVEEVIGADKSTDSNSDDSEYLPTPPRRALDDKASVSAFGIDDSNVEPHVTASSAPPQVTPATVQ
jgi:hypothetical protein